MMRLAFCSEIGAIVDIDADKDFFKIRDFDYPKKFTYFCLDCKKRLKFIYSVYIFGHKLYFRHYKKGENIILKCKICGANTTGLRTTKTVVRSVLTRFNQKKVNF